MKAILIVIVVLLAFFACQKMNNQRGSNGTSPGGQKQVVEPQDEGIWTVNFDSAKKTAAENNLNLMILFTGSDWCPWCVRMNDEIFSDEKFQKEVVKKFVPVKLDFPSKIDFPEDIKKKYNALAEQYGIKGFPTVILADCDGNAFAECGYQEGGAEAFLKTLETKLKASELKAK